MTTTTATAAPLTGNTAGIAVGVTFAIIMLVLLVVLFLFMFCGKKRMRLYKSICGGKCAVCCSETHECMQFSLSKCCGCLSWTKMVLLGCYDCCCSECSQGRVEPSGNDVESGIIVTVTPPADEKKDSFMPLPPSVEEVDPVDSKGNPRRLPPLEPTKPSPMTIIEEDPDETPGSPTKLPAISPRSDEPEPSQDASDGKMEPEEKVEELKTDEELVAVAGEEVQGQEAKADEQLVAVAGEQVQGQETEVEITNVKELTNVQEEGVVKEDPTVKEGEAVQNEQETTPAESAATPVPQTPDQPETVPPETDQPTETAKSADQPETPSETAAAQPTQQTTAAKELDLQPVEHSTPRD